MCQSSSKSLLCCKNMSEIITFYKHDFEVCFFATRFVSFDKHDAVQRFHFRSSNLTIRIFTRWCELYHCMTYFHFLYHFNFTDLLMYLVWTWQTLKLSLTKFQKFPNPLSKIWKTPNSATWTAIPDQIELFPFNLHLDPQLLINMAAAITVVKLAHIRQFLHFHPCLVNPVVARTFSINYVIAKSFWKMLTCPTSPLLRA